MGSTILPRVNTVQGTERHQRREWFLSLEGEGSSVLTEEGMVLLSKRRTGVYEGTQVARALQERAGTEAKGREGAVTFRE